MPKGNSICAVCLLGGVLYVLVTGCSLNTVRVEDETEILDDTEILRITVGEPTLLDDLVYQNTASVSVSRTGVVAAFFPQGRFHRTSIDGGRTGSERIESPEIFGGAQSTTLRDGGVIRLQGDTDPIEGKPDWFALKTFWFTDDFTSWETEIAEMHVTNNIPGLDVTAPSCGKGKMIQTADGALLMPIYGRFSGDIQHRAYLVRSLDQGRTWHYYATISYTAKDPNPELPGQFIGSCEASTTLLPDGRMLAMVRTQGSQLPAQYRPLYACWSDDLGKTWTQPTATQPHLMCISPTLATLDNGVVVCQYGRLGFHVAFSLDNGHTWQDRVSFSDLPEPIITGQFDMIKAGPNELVAIGSDAEGTKMWPITVERVKVSPAYVSLTGRVVNRDGNPIAHATVERSPNRYAVGFWQESTELDPWGVGPQLVGSPKLAYRPILKENHYPTIETDARGEFRLDGIPLGEWVLTVEANGYTPQWHRGNFGPKLKSPRAEFRMTPGKAVRGRIMDNHGAPVSGASVVLNTWHVYSDSDGYFAWPVETPLPQQVNLKVHKRFDGAYQSLTTTMPLAQVEEQPIVLQHQPRLARFPLWDAIPGREDEFLRRMLENAPLQQVE